MTNLKFPQPGLLRPYGALPVPLMTPDLIALIRTGQVMSLGLPIFEGIPVPGPMVPFSLTPRLRHDDPLDIAPATAAAETISMAIHTGTHMDALCHIGERQDLFGGPAENGEPRLYAGRGRTVEARAQVHFQGQRHLDASAMVPVITRGILLDVAAAKGLEILPDGYVVTVEDVQLALGFGNVKLTPGCAVLLRTGFYRHLREGNPAYENAIAGLGLEAAQFLVENGMTLVGADNMTVEAFPPLDHAVHRFLIVHNGITLVENLYLEEMSVQPAYEFVLIITPLRIQGATGSWVHPIALL